MTEPVVFLPGLMCDTRLFEPQLMLLGRERPVMVAPITGGERIEEIASGLLPLLPAKFALAGLSMGGIVAMEILRRAPERVTRLALMDTEPLAETPQVAAWREPLIVKARAGGLEAALAEVLRPEHLAAGPRRLDVLARMREMAHDLGPGVFVKQMRALQRRRDQQGALRRLRAPTLVLCGAEDTLTPVKRHSFMAELIPNAVLRLIEGAGHIPTLEAPEATNRALQDWLAQPYVLR
ncbi:MAG: alpha/beta fold hydrolase [Paracoccaceae bacterium]